MDVSVNKLSKTLVAGAALACAAAAGAAPTVGFDPTGSGTYTTTADLWTDSTDSGLAVGFTGTIGETTTFIAQTTVAQMSLGGSNVSPPGLDSSPGGAPFEITKTVKLQEVVAAFFSAGPISSVVFGDTTQTSDVDPTTAGLQQLAIYFDALGDGSTANPNNVSCYGTGTPTGCAADGTLIASAHVVSNLSSFTANGGTGTGSFDIRFMFDYVNAAYLDFATGSIFAEKITGTLNVPAFYSPTVMWDGTPTASGLLFKVDSSESFFVPEPGSLMLAGLGLAALGMTTRRRRSR